MRYGTLTNMSRHGSRPRIDLDGVPLYAESNPQMAVAIFRYRTAEGLQLLIPESADVLVPWGDVATADVDLRSGQLTVELAAAYVERNNWLRGAGRLVGRWTDRLVLHADDAH